MLTRILIAVAAIGAMSLTAFAQTREQGSPEQNAVARQATAQRLIDGEKACTGCDIFQVDLSYQELTSRDLSGARIRQADLSLSTFDHTKFAGADMSIVNAFGIKAEDADFSNVNFEDAALVGGWFSKSKFHLARFNNTNISGSYFEDAEGLTQFQLNTACGDEFTRLPAGLIVVPCKIQ